MFVHAVSPLRFTRILMQRRWAALSQGTGVACLHFSRLREMRACNSSSSIPSEPPPLYAGNGSSYYCHEHDADKGSKRIINPGKKVLGPFEKEIVLQNRRRIISTEKPPISREQAEKWNLDRLIYKRPFHFRLTKPRPIFLLPPEQRIYSLGPEMDRLDAVYRQKGYFTPSEVAHVFMPLVPTFFVEMRYIVERIPPDVLLTLDRHIPRSRFAAIFEHYPMLFKFHRRKFQRSAVKLNDDMWFVRAHPDFQKANALQREHNADYNSSVGGVLSSHLPLPAAGDIDAGAEASATDSDGEKKTGSGSSSQEPWRPLKIRIFEILVRHLPRVPSTESDYQARRYAAVRLIEWVNGFPQSEIDLLNKVSPPQLVFLLSRCVHVFQLTGGTPTDTNLFCDREHFLRLPQWKERVQRSGEMARVENEASTFDMDTFPPPLPSAAAAHSSPSNEKDDLCEMDGLFLGDDDGGGRPQRTIEEEEEELRQRYMAEEGGSGAGGEDEEASGSKDADALTDDAENANISDDDADGDGESVAMPVSTPLESIFVRRRPPSVSPRSWSNFTAETSPEKDIFSLIASRLAPPPSIPKDPSAKENVFYRSVIELQQAHTKRGELSPPSLRFEPVWRWVLVDELYQELSPDQRRRLPFYKGLVNFLRLHGEVFELSNDFRYVIAHDPSGTPAPYTPAQRDFSLEERAVLPSNFDSDSGVTATLIGEENRIHHAQLLGNSQVPTSRKQLAILDPLNPLLLSDVLHEEMAKLVPPRGHIPKARLMGTLPPIMRAAMPNSYNMAANAGLVLFRDHGVACLRRAGGSLSKGAPPREKAPTPSAASASPMTLEEAVEVLRESIPEHGATPRALTRMYLPNEVVETFRAQVGSLRMAVKAYPQYFEVEENAAAPGECVIRLKEDAR